MPQKKLNFELLFFKHMYAQIQQKVNPNDHCILNISRHGLCKLF